MDPCMLYTVWTITVDFFNIAHYRKLIWTSNVVSSTCAFSLFCSLFHFRVQLYRVVYLICPQCGNRRVPHYPGSDLQVISISLLPSGVLKSQANSALSSCAMMFLFLYHDGISAPSKHSEVGLSHRWQVRPRYAVCCHHGRYHCFCVYLILTGTQLSASTTLLLHLPNQVPVAHPAVFNQLDLKCKLINFTKITEWIQLYFIQYRLTHILQGSCLLPDKSMPI